MDLIVNSFRSEGCQSAVCLHLMAAFIYLFIFVPKVPEPGEDFSRKALPSELTLLAFGAVRVLFLKTVFIFCFSDLAGIDTPPTIDHRSLRHLDDQRCVYVFVL